MNNSYQNGIKAGLREVERMKQVDQSIKATITDTKQAMNIIDDWGDLIIEIEPSLQKVYDALKKDYDANDSAAYVEHLQDFTDLSHSSDLNRDAMEDVYNAIMFLYGVDRVWGVPIEVTSPFASGYDWLSQVKDMNWYIEKSKGQIDENQAQELESLKNNLDKFKKVPALIEKLAADYA